MGGGGGGGGVGGGALVQVLGGSAVVLWRSGHEPNVRRPGASDLVRSRLETDS